MSDDASASPDPYAAGLASTNFYASKLAVHSRLVVVLRGTVAQRGLSLITTPTRAVRQGEVHELIISDEPAIGPGSVINRISSLGFVEILNAGVLAAGDEFYCRDTYLGRLAGFDYTHMPNHMNIVLSAASLRSGEERGLKLEDPVIIRSSNVQHSDRYPS